MTTSPIEPAEIDALISRLLGEAMDALRARDPESKDWAPVADTEIAEAGSYRLQDVREYLAEDSEGPNKYLLEPAAAGADDVQVLGRHGHA